MTQQSPPTYALARSNGEQWIDEHCQAGVFACVQIISASIVFAAEQNYNNYGDTVYPRGGEGPGGQPIPY
jgi:hypothetical protein